MDLPSPHDFYWYTSKPTIQQLIIVPQWSAPNEGDGVFAYHMGNQPYHMVVAPKLGKTKRGMFSECKTPSILKFDPFEGC